MKWRDRKLVLYLWIFFTQVFSSARRFLFSILSVAIASVIFLAATLPPGTDWSPART
jgi:hypothetical protein